LTETNGRKYVKNGRNFADRGGERPFRPASNPVGGTRLKKGKLPGRREES